MVSITSTAGDAGEGSDCGGGGGGAGYAPGIRTAGPVFSAIMKLNNEPIFLECKYL